MGRSATLRVDITADAKGVDRGVSQADSKLSRLGSGARKVGKAVGAGLAVAGVAAIALGKQSLDAASRVQQATGAISTVFGKHARAVKRWARSAADDVGLARSEYMELSSTVGSQLQNMGVSQEKSASRSRKLIKLGADLAATYGGTVSEAVAAVSSLMRGEADPIERYGVSIKEADISAQLASKGLDKLEGSAGKTARTQALLGLLTKQTSKAQGAFSRESNTYAGQQERLRAKLENVKASIGKGLLPIMTRLTGWVSNRLLPGTIKLGREFSAKFGPTLKRIGGFITGTVVPAAKRLWEWFVTKIAPGIKRAVTPVIEGARKAFDKIRAAIKRNEPELKAMWARFKQVVEVVVSRVLPIVGKLAGFLVKTLGRSISGAIDLLGGISRTFGAISGAVQRLIGWLGRIRWPSPPGWLKDVGGSIGGLFAADVTTGAPRLGGGGARYAGPGGSLARASFTDGLGWLSSMSGSGSGRAAATIVDARVYVDARGAIGLDGDELARVVERSQTRRARKLYGAAARVGGGA